MHKSFLRVEDWAPIYNNITNPCWLQILRIIEQFQQLVQTQKKQIVGCIKQLTIKKVELIKHFNKYKNSLKFHGEIKKQVLSIYDNEKAKFFFNGYFSHIQQIIFVIGSNPRLLAKILACETSKKYVNPDFIQSLIYHLYPCYLPAMIQNNMNNSLVFVQQIINQWSYDIRLCRPSSYSVIDQIINGFNKAPQIVCYVQKISINFMKQVNAVNMEHFAFDEEAIKHEVQLKKSMACSQNPPPKSKWGKFKALFGKKPDESSISTTSDSNDVSQLENEIKGVMERRQEKFLNLVMNTIKNICQIQTPFLLNQMLFFFHNKIKRQIQQAAKASKFKSNSMPANQPQINNQNEASDKDSNASSKKTTRHNSEPQIFIQQKEYFKHYCYFLMTNLICEQLHNKFTISHEDTGMRPADLQNITQVIKIITQIFQCHIPEGEKYKNRSLFKKFQIAKIQHFYTAMITKAICQPQTESQKYTTQDNPQNIRQILLNLHQNTYVLSFNDIKSLVGAIKSLKQSKQQKQLQLFNQLGLTEQTEKMKFLQQEKIRKIFDPQNKRVQFNQLKPQVDKIFFIFNSQKPNIDQLVTFYTGSQSPLKQLPMLTNSLMYQSNLNVTEALQITKSLKLMQKLCLNETKKFINKIALRYSNLYLKDSQILSNKFKNTLGSNLIRNINRKSILLLHRDQISSRISFTDKLIQFYTQQLRSSQFYERISDTFIHNIKIKAYIRIQNDQLKIYQNTQQMKGVNLQTLLMVDGENKQKKPPEQYILRTSFKSFTSILELLDTIKRNNITRTALHAGRRMEQFNQMFSKLCFIVVSYIEQYMKKRQILQNLNKQKLAKTIVNKMQNQIYNKLKPANLIEQDKIIEQAKKNINKELFFTKDLEQLKVDWKFLFNEGKKKFDLMIKQNSISERIRHFEELFRMVFTIIGFSMSKNKISAQIINPVIQYLILQSDVNKHYQCLFSMQTLKWNTSPQTSYNIILYESSLTYISKMMIKDYPLLQ